MSRDELRRIIADVARHSQDRSIATTRAELTVRLTEAGIDIPSESWLDALAREATHGRSYILDTEDSARDRRDDPAWSQALQEAPANLATQASPPGSEAAPATSEAAPSPSSGARPESTRHALPAGAPHRWVLAVLPVGLALLWVWHRRRHEPVTPRGDGGERRDGQSLGPVARVHPRGRPWVLVRRGRRD